VEIFLEIVLFLDILAGGYPCCGAYQSAAQIPSALSAIGRYFGADSTVFKQLQPKVSISFRLRMSWNLGMPCVRPNRFDRSLALSVPPWASCLRNSRYNSRAGTRPVTCLIPFCLQCAILSVKSRQSGFDFSGVILAFFPDA
jgi:hypothetical protein